MHHDVFLPVIKLICFNSLWHFMPYTCSKIFACVWISLELIKVFWRFVTVILFKGGLHIFFVTKFCWWRFIYFFFERITESSYSTCPLYALNINNENLKMVSYWTRNEMIKGITNRKPRQKSLNIYLINSMTFLHVLVYICGGRPLSRYCP